MTFISFLRRSVVRFLRPDARNSLAIALLLSGHDRWPRPVDAWSERKVLVISPHADDEAIGCGGTVLKHVAEGAEVTVLHLTDGRNGCKRLQDPHLPPDERATLVAWVRQTREAEARAWAAGAGVRAVEFLGLSDSEVSASPQAVAGLKAVLERIQPDLIYVPAITDLLEDHWRANLLLDAALNAAPGAWQGRLLLRSYEVWSPLPANRVVDVSAEFERKLELLRLYKSQLADVDYCRAIEGLNAYRSTMLPRTAQGYAEAFLEASLPGWRAVLAGRH
ncbi:PIG-L deacetylase family protein [Ideonella paludis]|uniref:PIG-L family deacetylase n=1 Tax=Ideonella paludis TaxID=1233411 RepID=A0ABS5E1B2_9BURK|nr:PIG-L deacetylase family protein [Ideonella paludis]MBQ0937190.1 PIG-L family deacetylase [Ideonella paludis]